MKVYDGYTSEDYVGDEGWLRIFCAPLPDDSCGLLLVQHHSESHEPQFDHLTEANLGLVTGASHAQAIARITTRDAHTPLPAAYRRLARLFVNGSLIESIKDTLAERGLERAVAYNTSYPNDTKRLDVCDRAGFRTELRHGISVKILDL